MAKRNQYFPCHLCEHEDKTFSIVCSDFHYFDSHFADRECGGYTVERLAKKLVKEHGLAGIQFDSEAGMFCAFADRKMPLKNLCLQLRRITGGESRHRIPETIAPSISLKDAERLLLKGFVLSLDEDAQREFLKHVPPPGRSANQEEYLDKIQNGSEEEKIKAVRKINGEACSKVRKWDHYLSHPTTTEILMREALRDDCPPKLHYLLVRTLEMICGRHLPDMRLRTVFERSLASSSADTRYLGIMGLNALESLTPELMKPLRKDRSKGVRSVVSNYFRHWQHNGPGEYASWMFDSELVAEVRHEINETK